MYCVVVFIAQALFITLSVAQIQPHPEVTISQGTLRGKYEVSANGRQYAAFQGIPYAQPPVGKLRFKEPQSPRPWIGVYDATELRTECLQYSHMSYKVQGDEDCLHLNVYTPNVPPNADSSLLLDVIVFIHGSAFMFLNGYSFGPRYLMNRDVVFVNFNYRLGPLGFLSTEDAIIPGNNGLKDQSEALRWVQRNIRAFGGNPASVTLMGLSAGGVSVHYHYLSPLSQGLFVRGISFSGTVLCSWATMDNAREKAIQLGNNVGCNTEDSTELLHCLRHRPGHQIVQQSKHFMGWLYNPYSPFGPTVEAVGSKTPFITQEPYEILKSGLFQHLPWVTSVNSEEGLYPAAEFCSSPEKLQELETRWSEIIPHILDFNLTVEQDLKNNVCMDIKKYYLKNKTVAENVDQVIQMIGDRLFVTCAEEAAKIQAETSSAPVYFYYFNYRGAQSLSNVFSHNNDNYGVSHGDDVFYFIDIPFVNTETTESDKQMIQKFLDFVTSYARNGIPRFTPNIVLPEVKGGLPALKYIKVQSPIKFKEEITTDLGHSKFWLKLPLHESINIAKREGLPSAARDEL